MVILVKSKGPTSERVTRLKKVLNSSSGWDNRRSLISLVSKSESCSDSRGQTASEEDGGAGGRSSCGFRPFPPTPFPRHPNMLDLTLYMGRITEYFRKLGYNTEGEPTIRVNTKLSLRHHAETARLLIRAGEQIKCLHALVLAIHFTNSTPLIERFTINFKSIINGKEYKHVVLGIYMYGAYGALGISRDPKLQDKPVIFTRLADLLSNFCQSYIQCGHDLLEIKVGGIIPRDPHSLAPLPFRLAVIPVKKIGKNEQQFANECDKIGKLLRVQMGPICIRQVRPPEMQLPTTYYDERKSLLSTTGTTATLADENTKLISKLRTMASEKASKISANKSLKPSSLPTATASTKTAVLKKKAPKE